MIRTPYDAIADQFSALRTELQPKEIEYLALLLEPLKEGSTILDLGCGTGHPMATRLTAQGHRVVGVDGSEAMLAMAKARLPERRWIHALIEEVDFEETFDAVVCWDSLFHLHRSQHEAVIRKIHRWLVPGGRLMISSGGLVENHPDGFTDTMFGQEFYYDSLPPAQMVALLEEIGFEILIAEMSNLPDGENDKGKWATVASRKT